MSFRRVKNSYLIRPLSKNSNFLWAVCFFVLNMSAKVVKKIQPIGHFSGLTLEKNYDFAQFDRKIKISRDLVGVLRNFTDTSIKIHIYDVQSSIAYRTRLNFFYLIKCAKS